MPDLRTSLRLDALASGALGVLLVVLAGVFDEALGLPVLLSVAVGAFLLAWAGLVAWVARAGRRGATLEVVVGNALWVAASVAFAFSGWVDLTGLGVAFVLAQAAAVAVLTDLQVLGLRRPARPLTGAPVG